MLFAANAAFLKKTEMEEQSQTIDIKAINEKIEKQSAFIELLTLEMNKVIVGQKQCLSQVLEE